MVAFGTLSRMLRGQTMLAGKRILLIIGGGIAAYKSLELIRRLQDKGASVTPVLTRAGEEFVTPLSVSALAGEAVHRDLFDLTTEAEMGHIELSRSADLIVVVHRPRQTSWRKWRTGQANDLASTLLLATDTPVMIAPAMNVRMWDPRGHPKRNLATLKALTGLSVIGPDEGDYGLRRIRPRPHGRARGDPRRDRPTAPDRAARFPANMFIVTSGPTHEPIDPVRYIANRSSGRAGHGASGPRLGVALGPMSPSSPAPQAMCRRPDGVDCHAGRDRLIEMLKAVEATRCQPMPPSLPPPWPTGALPRPLIAS